MAKVEAPNKGYNGTGPGNAVFVDGVAEVDDDAALNYYRDAGYKVSGKVQSPVEHPEPPDPREVGLQVVGTELRDAAVDPEPGDFLPPVNAGEDNPHGSSVVSPEIHASGPAGIRPGVVFVEDTDKQQERESEFAAARLVDGTPAAEAIAAEVDDLDKRGELELSDPGSAQVGAEAARDIARKESDADADEADERPVRAANKDTWVDFAVTQGANRDEAEAMTKAELIETYGG